MRQSTHPKPSAIPTRNALLETASNMDFFLLSLAHVLRLSMGFLRAALAARKQSKQRMYP